MGFLAQPFLFFSSAPPQESPILIAHPVPRSKLDVEKKSLLKQSPLSPFPSSRNAGLRGGPEPYWFRASMHQERRERILDVYATKEVTDWLQIRSKTKNFFSQTTLLQSIEISDAPSDKWFVNCCLHIGI